METETVVKWESAEQLIREGLRQAIVAGDVDAVRDWRSADQELKAERS